MLKIVDVLKKSIIRKNMFCFDLLNGVEMIKGKMKNKK